MQTESTYGEKSGRTEQIAAGILIVLGIGIRLWMRTPTDFWEDEIIASTHAMQPFWQLLVNTVRNDVHPPLYFVQLHFWSLVSASDLWLTANSVLWSLAALASLWWTTGKLYGSRMALLATTVFAVLPTPTYMADQLRMYAMLATLIIWAFYFASISFGSGTRNNKNLFCLLLLLVAIDITHAIGSIAVFCNGIFALGLTLAQPRGRRAIGAWLLIYGVSAICAAPWIVTGMLHDANLAGMRGIAGFVTSISSTIFGQLGYGNHALRIVGLVTWFAILAFGLAFRRSRGVTLAFILLPMALATVADAFYKPLFKWNFFCTLEAPFLAIVVAMGIQSSGNRIARLSWALCTLILLGVNIDTRLTVRESQGYRPMAELIRANYRPGDIVYAPQPSMFGAMAWYLEGPHWGSPLAIAAKPSPQWRKVYNRLGPRLVEFLGLEPQTQILHGKNTTMLIGNDSADQAIGASRIWLVTMPRVDLRPGYPPPELHGLKPQWTERERVWITLYASSPQPIITAH